MQTRRVCCNSCFMERAVPEENILSVSDLNRRARVAIEETFPITWVMGELSNFARPRSGHWYFTLKDENAQVRCAMFANRNRVVEMQPGDGQLVLLRGRVSLYEGRGEFQIIVDHMEAAGEGALRQAFDRLKLKLHGEGLFDPVRKQKLPEYPRRLAIITSPSGAAVRDVLAVLKRRWPILEIIVVPSSVQGADGETELVAGLSRAVALEPDVILLTRGGGSLEDLWCFNGESLARAIADCRVPVVSAVGHEIDVTISDFVADARAPTPSAAAELISPDRVELSADFRSWQRHISTLARRYLEHQRLKVDHAAMRVVDPKQYIARAAERLEGYLSRAQTCLKSSIATRRQRLDRLQTGLAGFGPRGSVQRAKAELEQLAGRCDFVMAQTLKAKSADLAEQFRMLHSLSPLPTIARGYALSTDSQGRVVSSIHQAAPGSVLTTHLSDGVIESRVDSSRESSLETRFASD